MTTRRRRTSGDVPPPGSDDFGRIQGIDATIKYRLYGAHITTFKQLAESSPDDIAARVGDFPGTSAELIQGWIDQARSLTSIAQEEPQSGTSSTAAPQDDELNSAVRLHAETFTVELLLHEDNTVHHTRITHHQSKGMASWANWNASQLVDFFAQQAVLHLPAPKAAVPAEPVAALPPEAAAPAEPVAALPPEPTLRSASTAGRVGVLHLRALEVVQADTGEPSNVVRHDQSFDVCLRLDLADRAAQGTAPLDYTAAVYARSLGGRSRQTVGEARGTIVTTDAIVIHVAEKTLPPGLYRLIATMSLRAPSAAGSSQGAPAMIEYVVLHVY